MEEVLAKYFSDELTPKERKEVEVWRNESEENAEEFLAYSKVWHSSGQVDSQSALASVLGKINREDTTTQKESKEQPKLSAVFIHFFKIAAAVLLGVGLGYFALYQMDVFDPGTIYTADDKVLEVILADGSVVTLSENSTLTYRESDGERLAELKGKAFFEVERDETKVFRVETDKNEVEVLGTSFLVNANKASVVVKSGKVVVNIKENKDVQIELVAGERSYYDVSAERLVKENNNNSNYLAWKTNLISFEADPLSEVVAFLNDNYDVQVELEGDDLANCQLTADFKDQDVEEVLEIISLTFSLELQKLSGKRFVLNGEGC